MDFDGANDYVVIPATAPVITGDLTWSGWFATSASGTYVLVGFYDTGTTVGWGIGCFSGVMQLWTNAGGGNGGLSAVNNGNLIHYAITLDQEHAKFFLNGMSDGTATSAAPGSFTGAKAIGAASGGVAPWGGILHETLIFDHPLAPSEVFQLTALGPGGFATPRRRRVVGVTAAPPAARGNFLTLLGVS